MALKPVNPVKPVRSARNKPAVRYFIHVMERPTKQGENYGIRRRVSDQWECWRGREMGWMPLTLDHPGKRYSHYGHALRTMRALQERDREALSAAGRARQLASLAPELREALRSLVELGDAIAWERHSAPDESVERARVLLRIADRGY
jgi:hypothetical protein